ncbi:hypothetical protein QTJ16_005856 [Diplocarpon rosae]|uniref:Nuclear pore complex protein An-Nup82 n=1 Tax=Diplocarpon rosae TaxID=946125 RepID=A0AAD9WBZ2_9HELO|nr:hypothetical protein QTJ16_005856 [Diplocarpon rosae]PBP18874.1 nuclear pore complex protein An-Nup82 [Diplocarpon rosae]
MQKQKIKEYTPGWLSKPSPGHDIFSSASSNTTGSQLNGSTSARKNSTKPGPLRTIARRGTEVFVAVGKEMRWADLVYLKDAYEERRKGNSYGSSTHERSRGNFASQYEEDHAQGYRTIKTQAADDIRQLIISPNGNCIAILTTHTVHVAILPEPSLLTAADSGPMKLKSFTLGPTTHVTSQAGIASALWHPLGVDGFCLVTVTHDAVVRVWELSVKDRWSFDKPTLAIDLQKLADGQSLDQDFGASLSGMSKGFSPDSFEMEVASACFAGRGSGGWSPMTLWIAMREGDVYALCPLLPEKWSPPRTLIPSLSVSIVAKVAAMEDDPTIPQNTKLLAQQQLDWMSEIDSQEPTYGEPRPGEPLAEIYHRPSHPGKTPKLQGPFDLDLAPEESEESLDDLLSDILVIGGKVDTDQLMFGEEDDLEMEGVDQEGLSAGVVCLLTSSGRLSVCLDLDGVEAQWLPRTKSKARRLHEEVELPTLLTFEVLDTSKDNEVWEGDWPVFSHDVLSRYAFYITNTTSVTYISLQPWAFRLDSELNNAAAGAEFRIDLLAKAENSTRQRIYTQNTLDHYSPLAACDLMNDPDLGYFLLTATTRGPIALTFESEHETALDFRYSRSRSLSFDEEPDNPIVLFEPRPVYEPSYNFGELSALPEFLGRLEHSKYKRTLKEEVRLSPATLQIMAEAHKVLSEETHRVGTAAAELFRRCARLQVELKEQIKKANEVATRIEAITGDDIDDGPAISANLRIEARLQEATENQKVLADRFEVIRQRVGKGTSRELSDKEKAWIHEVKVLEKRVIGECESNVLERRKVKEPWERYQEVKVLKDEILDQIEEIATAENSSARTNLKVPSEIRRAKMAQIMALLDRESALVEGAKSRLERLSLS